MHATDALEKHKLTTCFQYMNWLNNLLVKELLVYAKTLISGRMNSTGKLSEGGETSGVGVCDEEEGVTYVRSSFSSGLDSPIPPDGASHRGRRL